MSIQLKVPSLGESVTQATIGAWLKKEGDPVREDEPIVEVESEKATVALPSPAAGVLRKILRVTGDTVAVGEVIGELDEAGASATAAPTGRPPDSPAGGAGRGEGEGRPVPVSPPSARRLMAERGVSAREVEGTGPGGQVRKQDVLRALEAPREPPAGGRPRAEPPGVGARERIVPMSPLRRTVARRLVEAQHAAAILTTFNEVDMTRVLALRERLGEPFLARHGVKLGFMSFFVKAAVEALRAFPAVNAEVRGTDVVYKDHYDVGVAVGGGKGLVVPVIRDADALSFAEI
jgi:2-oxoglutarate dehydrogenase E2 component (dihydrolipoamide succinyltransferase)